MTDRVKVKVYSRRRGADSRFELLFSEQAAEESEAIRSARELLLELQHHFPGYEFRMVAGRTDKES